MKQHREASHSLKCVLCGFTAVNSLVLNEHSKTSHKFNYVCEHCEFSCPGKDDMAVHVNTTHEPRVKKKIFPCDSCDVVFGESRDLSEYMNHNNQVPENDQIILHKVLGILAA